MKNQALTSLVNKVMAINATTPGMGSAATGIIGASGNGSDTVYALKKDTMAFATAFNQDLDTVHSLANKVNASLMTLQIIGVINETVLESLLSDVADIMSRSQ